MSGNFYRAIAAIASQLESKPCWIVPHRGQWTFGDVLLQSAGYAAALRLLGVTVGDRVLVQVEKSPEALLLYLACLRNGAVFVPLNSAYTSKEISYFATDCEPKLMVVDPVSVAALQGIACNCGAKLRSLDTAGGGDWLAEVQRAGGADSLADVSAECQSDDLAAIVYTSGTTGHSKGAMLSHGNLESNARALTALWAFEARDVLLHALPIFHIHGLFIAMHCALLAGATTHLLAKLDMNDVIAALPSCTVFMGVPTYYTRLLSDPRFSRAAAQHMRLFVCGSAPLLPSTFDEFAERSGHKILERYGMTEAGIICSNPYIGERIAGTVGFALPGVSTRIADAGGGEVPRGEPGVLELSGANLFRGYWRMPDKTAEEMRADGYFITGDIATMASDGRVSIVGRAKDLIISGGFNIYPKEIELEIDSLPGVLESAVIGVPHADFGEAVVAIVAVSANSNTQEADVQQALQGRLAKFKRPKRVLFVADLPRNAMGKVQKTVLRETYANIFAGRG